MEDQRAAQGMLREAILSLRRISAPGHMFNTINTLDSCNGVFVMFIGNELKQQALYIFVLSSEVTNSCKQLQQTVAILLQIVFIKVHLI